MDVDTVNENSQESEGKVRHLQIPENEPWYRSITIEPALFLMAFAITLCSPVLQNLVLMKACLTTFKFNETVCDNLTNLKPVEDEIQPYSAQLFMYKSLIEAVIPAGMSFYIGPWSDMNGRRPLLLIPTLGFLLMYAGYLFLSLGFAKEYNTYYLLLASMPVAFSGGFVAFITGAFCYISDISTPAERSWRMGVAEAALLVGLPSGMATSSFLLKWGGYPSVFGTSCVMCAMAFLYTFIFVSESIEVNEMSSSQRVFDFNLIKDMLRTCCKKRPAYRRLTMFLVMLMMAIIIFSLDGDLSVAYLYTREKFSWTIQEFALYSTASSMISTVGTLLGLHIFSNVLKFDDAPVAVFACFMKALSLMVVALATESWVMYAASAVGVFGGITSPLGRAILSKSVHPDDVGKVFSLTSSLEALTPVAAAPLYTYIYKATYLTVPGAFYMLSSGLYVINFGLLITVAVIFYKFPITNYNSLENSINGVN